MSDLKYGLQEAQLRQRVTRFRIAMKYGIGQWTQVKDSIALEDFIEKHQLTEREDVQEMVIISLANKTVVRIRCRGVSGKMYGDILED